MPNFINGRHWADGHRIYDGCPDSTMRKRMDKEQKLLEYSQEKIPGLHIVYYPAGEFFLGFVNNKIVTPEVGSRVAAICNALSRYNITLPEHLLV